MNEVCIMRFVMMFLAVGSAREERAFEESEYGDVFVFSNQWKWKWKFLY